MDEADAGNVHGARSALGVAIQRPVAFLSDLPTDR